MLGPKQKKDSRINTDRLNRQPKIMLFDLSVGGHHAAYIQHLINYWQEHQLSVQLNIVVVPKFLEQHKDVVEMSQSSGNPGITFVSVSEVDLATLGDRSDSLKRKIRNLQEWKLLRKYIDILQPDECLIMYFDTYQTSLQLLGHHLPCPVSGIYFRPRFHYGDFQPGLFSFQEKIWHWLEQKFINEVIKHPQFKTLYCLDNFAVKHFEPVDTQAQVVHLPDPVQVYPDITLEPERLKAELNIDPHRRTFLLFGGIDGRKGIHKVLDAVLLMPTELCEKLCILIVGPVNSSHRERIQAQIAAISESKPAQIVVHDRVIPDRENQPYFLLSDVVLATYRCHVGTSSILIRAAAAGKPVLSTNYGLMGEWTRHHQLGIAVNSAEPGEIAQAMTQFLRESPQKFCDRAKMQKFAEENSAENYAKVIFQHLAAN